MAITVLRPNGSAGASNYTITGGSANIHSALNDNSDATYIRRTQTNVTSVAQTYYGTTSITSSTLVKRVRLRTRCSTPTTSSKLTFTLATTVEGITRFGAAYQRKGVLPLAEYTGPWFTSPPGGGGWTQTAIDGVQVQITDYAPAGADRGYIYEMYVDVDIITKPTTTVTAPTGTITTTSRPGVTWTYSDVDGDPQTYYQLRVFTSAQYGAVGFNVETTTPFWDSGALSGDNTTGSIAALLPNGTYRVYVRTGKTVSSAPYWSNWAFSQFTVNVVPPTAPTLTLNHLVNEGRVTISALGAAPTGFASQYFELERSTDQSTWVQVRGGDALLPDNIGLIATSDYEAPRGNTVYYRARAVGIIGTDVYTSAWGTTASVVVANDGKWWFKPIANPEISVKDVRVSPGFDETVIEAVGVFRPFGRSSALVVTGGLQGYDGTFMVSAVGASEWAALEPVVTSTGIVYVETPLGTSKYVRFVSRNWDHGGTRGSTLRSLKLGYVEARA